MKLYRLLLPAISAFLVAACEIESSLDLVNPYLTARIILALEQQGIEYRLSKDGAIHYSNKLVDEVEAARVQAHHMRGKTSAVIARPGQARLIVEQFESADIVYAARELEHFILITWDYPRDRGPEATANGMQAQ